MQKARFSSLHENRVLIKESGNLSGSLWNRSFSKETFGPGGFERKRSEKYENFLRATFTFAGVYATIKNNK